MNQSPVDALVMHKMLDKVGYPVSAATVYGSGYAPLDFQGCRDRIARIREWARTLEDVEVRAAYFKWLDHYDRGINDAEREMETRSMGNRGQNYIRERQLQWEQMARCDKQIPDPPK